jgi:hypothetical protein
MTDRFSCSAKGDFADAMEGNLRNGREDCVHRRMSVRKVRSNGEIRWGGEMIFLSEAQIGEPVGVAETEAGDWLVRFADIDLGIIDRRRKKLRRFTAARPPRHSETPALAAGPVQLEPLELR